MAGRGARAMQSDKQQGEDLREENRRLRRDLEQLTWQLKRQESLADTNRRLLTRVGEEKQALLKELERQNQALAEALERRRESDERLASIIRHSPCTVSLRRPDGGDLFTSEGQRELEAKLAPKGNQAPLQDLELLERRVAASGRAASKKLHMLALDGPRVLAVNAFPVFNAKGGVEAVGRVTTDVTEQEKLRSEMVHKGQLATIGELAAGIAHEINNPVNGVINFAQILLDQLGGKSAPAPEATRSHLETILAEAERIAAIVSSLLSLARRDRAPDCAFCDLGKVMDECLRLSGALLVGDGVRLETFWKDDAKAGRYQALCRPAEIQQVFLNLITNARQALATVQGREKVLTIGLERRRQAGHEMVVATVADNGPGVATDVLPFVFEPFYTTKPAGQGTGLGLSVSREIVEAHGGTIAVGARPGGPTAFTVALPACWAPAA